ncbi:Crp/Fnr family transcriptional regulator [Paenibacillus sp. GCM10023248]|uniref:Crp/Fnr family transcriptional regulator n=1 Tax=Bacillales TaxID=1385 RepID=UPI0023788E37|nr:MULTISPECIES: Crp/Fnr family transcriptional regulator [Bacillales]MDD9266764.1 Crp/Fnr family transcriptional regulator [Paenibacillus sp. MAHUQ-63]MDR6883709.1 CRP/FNR family transcriptional regulator [Bacillus sp. 3255]
MAVKCQWNEDNKGITKFFSEENFHKLQSIMYLKHAVKGDYLFWEGDVADKLYYIIKGGVRITKLSETGKSFILYLHQAGDLFGQMDPFQNSVQSFSAEVTTDCEIGVMQRKDLEVLLWQHGDMAIEFMQWMGLMHRMTETKFRDLMMYGKPGALCSLLIRLSNSYGVPKGPHTLINYKINNTEMADMIGATRESVNRMLSDMKKEDAVEIQNGQIVIKDLTYLRDICHCENCPKEICRM